MNASTPFTTNITLLDKHIDTVMEYCEADYAQVSLVAISMFGFILSHAGMRKTSLLLLDFSISGSGKSHNIDLQYQALLRPIINEQKALQASTNDGEERTKRYMNIHRNRVTIPALYECFKTVPAQLIINDELGLSLKTNDEIIHTVTELYGLEETTLPVLKTELPSTDSVVSVALSFIGATTLDYFGSKEKLKHHLLGGFVNRSLIVFNNRLKLPEEINPIGLNEIDTSAINEQIVELLKFLRENSLEVSYCITSKELLTQFKQEIQSIKINFLREGNENFGFFYNRIAQNTIIIIRIFHALRCFEKGQWDENVTPSTTELAVAFMKQIIYPQIDKLIDYLTDNSSVIWEEKKIEKIKYLVETFLNEHGTMPKIREIQQRMRISKKDLLSLTKGFLEIQPATTVLRYCVNEQ
ncbi:MAG: hypothetical protein Q8O20_10925 [Sulfuricurvum sp.]|uniref:hypothetical protein n=1 Tax=Sulfuricurvum sp. TaxID=2025608 RepID=UPI002733921F|nr:hypothetical protein [Sulfuricurvum sp.]MDP2851573.1 hypothetical protein [Sulfuricurvum sp.]